ncbi:MAG: diguanylate cyclase [Desulfobulbus sp.]|nr:diguanylate cyclase [Desulfobulbus sp.]
MYHRLLKVFIATQDSQLETILQTVQPEERFSHQFLCSHNVDEFDLNDYSIVILDFDTVAPDSLERIEAIKNDHVAVIGCFTADSFPILSEHYQLFDQVWIKPFADDKLQTSLAEILRRFKEREDAILGQKYLDTLIDSLPDLIWFKDARGSHLKVNDSFCRTVNKTKAQVEGRGHYYIWDLEPDEYAQGEYICLESEEIVLNRKETCLFDETVKCGDELRKFKTYKSPIFDTDGEVVGTVGFAHDVTDLQNLLIELNILIEGLPFAVMVTDKDRSITSVNQKFIDIFVLDRSEFIGKKVDFFIDESKPYTRSKRWLIEKEDGNIFLLSKNKVLKIHEEKLLDIFGVLAGHVFLFVDITLEYQYKNKLLIDANTDHLTKLNNRRSLQDFMRKTPCQSGMLLLLADLDNFKEVNDQHGHDEGDRVLVAFADLLQQLFPAENLFRLGGDEFAIILPQVEGEYRPKQYAEQLLSGFAAKVARKFPYTNISVSIGGAIDAGDGDFGELFKRADMALYDSKNAGKSAYTFCNK